MIYTGYFAKLKTYIEAGLTPISISRWPPNWFEGEKCSALAPPVELLKGYKTGKINEEQYKQIYLSDLDRTDIRTVLDYIAKGRDIVLCCYEKPDAFCHRHVLAEYVTDKYNIPISEYKT